MAKYNARTVPRGMRRARRPLDVGRLRIGYHLGGFPRPSCRPSGAGRHRAARSRPLRNLRLLARRRARWCRCAHAFALAFDHFIDLDKVSDAEAAARIRRRRDRHPRRSSPDRRPARASISSRSARRPCRCRFSGSPAPLAPTAYDYIIADRLLVPSGARALLPRAGRAPAALLSARAIRRGSSIESAAVARGLRAARDRFRLLQLQQPGEDTRPEVFDVRG